MQYAEVIRGLGRAAHGGRDMGEGDAQALFGAMLDGGMPDLELGAVLSCLRNKGESAEEIRGFLAASRSRMNLLEQPSGRPRPIVLPTYGAARHGANLTPLVALMLQRFGMPVLLHGTLDSYGRGGTASILREFGVLPSTSVHETNRALAAKGLAFAPTAVLSPGLAQLLSLRARLGLRNVAHSMVKMLDPFDGEALLVATATHPPYLDKLRAALSSAPGRALVFRATEGEPHANPKRRPKMELIDDGRIELLFEAEHDTLVVLPALPEEADVATTAAWIRQVLAGAIPVPMPIHNQLAGCLYGSGYCRDLNEAKAMVAIELHSPAHA